MMGIPEKLKENKFFKNTSWLVIERVAEMVITLLIGAFTNRYLGPEKYGLINYGLSFIAIFTFIANLGLDGIVISYLVRDKDNEGNIIGSSILMRLISGLVSIFLVYCTVRLFEPGDRLLLTISIIQSISLIFKSFEIIDIWFQSTLSSRNAVIAKIAASLLVAAYKLVLIITVKSVEWFAFAVVVQSIVIAVVLSILYFKKGGKQWSVSYRTCGKLLTKSHHFILSGMIMVIYTQMDKIMIGKLLNSTQVGYYSASMAIAQLWYFIPNAVINSARPVIVSAKLEDEKEYKNKLIKLFAFIIFSGIIVSIGITIFSKLIIIILYGKDYLPAAAPLVINVWAGIFALLGVARDIWYISEDKMKYAKTFITCGAIINITLNAVLIPQIGINGAAIATLITQVAVCFVIPLFFKGTREISVLMVKSLDVRRLFK